MYNIGITGTGSLIGQAIIKSIKRSEYCRDYKLFGFDYFENTVGSYWCDSNFLLPDILNQELIPKWLNRIEEIINEQQIAILFVGVDFELPVLAQAKARLESNTKCKLVISSDEVIKIGNDKYLTYQFLKDKGLYYPETYLPEECIIEKLRFPVIVKPRVGARSVGVNIVNSIEQLFSILPSIENPIIQEMIGTQYSEYTCGVISLNGTLQKSIALNRSLKDGNTFVSEYKNSYPSIIYEYINDITKYLNPFGACNFQLRIDKNGIPKMFEINPRHSGTTYIRSLFGYNEVVFILKYLLENREIDFQMNEGKVIRHFEETLVS